MGPEARRPRPREVCTQSWAAGLVPGVSDRQRLALKLNKPEGGASGRHQAPDQPRKHRGQVSGIRGTGRCARKPLEGKGTGSLRGQHETEWWGRVLCFSCICHNTPGRTRHTVKCLLTYVWHLCQLLPPCLTGPCKVSLSWGPPAPTPIRKPSRGAA